MASDWEDGVRESLGSGWVPEGFQPLLYLLPSLMQGRLAKVLEKTEHTAFMTHQAMTDLGATEVSEERHA